MPPPPHRVALVGAGIGGLRCAHLLQNHGLEVVVFDKARGPGGRLPTRRMGEEFAFDHGAQYFTARSPRFAEQVRSWVREGFAAHWNGRIVTLAAGRASREADATERFVGVPGMSALGRHLARDLDLRLSCFVERIEKRGEGWLVAERDGPEHGPFDAVLCNAPPPQTEALLRPAHPALADRVAVARMAPCMAALAGWSAPLPLPFDGAFVADSPLAWVARNSSKPGRPAAECWVLHATADWSRRHFDGDLADLGADLLAALAHAAGRALPEPVHVSVHRWAYAQAEHPIDVACLFDPASGLGACGDWCGDARVEGAFLSGEALADAVLDWT